MPTDEDVLRRWAQAINDRDVDAAVAVAADDVDLIPLQVGVQGTYRGHEGVRRWLAELAEADPGHRVDVERVSRIEDGRVALFGTVCHEGTEISPYALLATVRDGRVAVVRSYLNDEDTLRFLGIIGGGGAHTR